MKFDKSLVRTILMAFGVVSFIIGVYQTIWWGTKISYAESLSRNYWIFMVSLACWLPLNYWRQQDARRVKEEEVARQVAALNQPKKGVRKGKKR